MGCYQVSDTCMHPPMHPHTQTHRCTTCTCTSLVPGKKINKSINAHAHAQAHAHAHAHAHARAHAHGCAVSSQDDSQAPYPPYDTTILWCIVFTFLSCLWLPTSYIGFVANIFHWFSSSLFPTYGNSSFQVLLLPTYGCRLVTYAWLPSWFGLVAVSVQVYFCYLSMVADE